MKKGRRFRWSLRTLFIAVAVIAVILAIPAWCFRAGIQQRKIIASLEARGVEVVFEQDWRSRLPYLYLSSKVWYVVMHDNVGPIDAELRHNLSKVESPDSFAFYRQIINRETLLAVAQQPNVSSVSFYECELHPRAFAGLKASHGLFLLGCGDGTELNECHFRDLIELSQVEIFHFSNSTLNVNEAILLGQADHLRLISLAWMTFSPDAVEKLSGLENLVDLRLEGSTVTDNDLCSLKLPLLQDLGLSSTGITNDGLQHLGNFPRLRQLSLSRTTVDDKGMQYLDQLEHLEVLILFKTNVTPEMVESLRDRGIDVHY